MKKVKLAVLALSIGILTAGHVAAATTDVPVTASVTGTCRFNAPPTVAFGALDQSSVADETATGDLTFWCTTGTAYTLGDETNPGVADGAFSGTLVDGLNSIDYSIAYNATSGVGSGKTTPITSTLTATILNADYVDKPAGNYSDTVTFTITP
jgi:spore coat protein U-like protein